ncbi:MAG TPA: thioesterase family protein [Chitinophaga sp.]|uniref:acyl-CoA thioesterase n=1 Tax=Chitinophaga sp. TaxID=1869181 RepID=UPI002B8D6D93|nr:thioesterase family protein [Chitinophaga sp.]HVI48149.1 thioesterase family protein [Chitinophaga sp.]
MARVKIDLPAVFPFSISIPVRIQDVNYGGHVGNDALVSLLHEARIQYLSSIGFKEVDHESTSLIMIDVAMTYKGEGFHGDIFKIEVAAGEFNALGFELFYRITAERDGQTITIAEAKTGMVCFDYKNRKVVKLPPAMKTALGG